MPHMQDLYFNRSVIYMCELNKKGAMGLIINKPFKDPTLNKIFENFYDEKGEIFNAVDQIYFGGPVMVERGIVLHSGNYKSNDSIKISNDFFISSHKKTLEDISAQRGPELCRLLLGHAGWKAGQLEREIENGDWVLWGETTSTLLDTGLSPNSDGSITFELVKQDLSQHFLPIIFTVAYQTEKGFKSGYIVVDP